jgi:hypothetical protein
MSGVSPGRRNFLWQAIPTAVFILAVGVELFGPHPIGVADNNDFPKVLGRLGIWVAPEFRADQRYYFVTDYRIDETNIWNSHLPTSEIWIARAAKQIGTALLPPGRFDMRVMGAMHALLATVAMLLYFHALNGLEWRIRALLTLVFLLVFSDAEYVQFFNTAYMDAASIVFLMLVFAVGWNVALDQQRVNWRWGLSFCLVGALFLGTKLQHQLCILPLGFFCVMAALRAHSSADRIVWAVAPAAFLATGYFMASQTPADYRVESAFSVVFTKLLPLSPDPGAALRELGRPATDLAYNHLHAFSPGTPLTDPTYRAGFLKDVTRGKILIFYLRHPGIMFDVLRADFLAFAPDIPVGNFGTMRRVDSPVSEPRAKALRVWSELRSQVCLRWPWHVPLLYLVMFLATFAALVRRSGIWPLTLAALATGCLSFAIGSLGDATETTRHIVLYQQATDMLWIIALLMVGKNAKPGPLIAPK